ncbi:MAG TPA: zinc-dependent alcohol dehydrogenase family protein [Acidimicrobiales bacterium]
MDGFRAWRLDEPAPTTPTGPLHRVDGPRPEPGPDEVVVEVHACAVCRTDLQLVEGDLEARRLPIVPGHQVVGTVVARGDTVVEPALGTRVGVAWIAATCGTCRFCRRGRENLCEQARFTGWDRDGGYATHVRARADFVHPLPDTFADVDAAPLLCGGAIGYRSLRVAGIGPDSSGTALGLYGFGASATCVIQIARHWGVDVHVCTRSARERQAALELGASWAGGYDERPPVPLDAAVTFAPSGDVVVAALQALDRGGVVAVNAIHLDRVPELDYGDLWWERSIRSVANVTRDDVRELLELAASIPIRTRTEVVALDDANDALRRLAAGDVSGSFVLEV